MPLLWTDDSRVIVPCPALSRLPRHVPPHPAPSHQSNRRVPLVLLRAFMAASRSRPAQNSISRIPRVSGAGRWEEGSEDAIGAREELGAELSPVQQ